MTLLAVQMLAGPDAFPSVEVIEVERPGEVRIRIEIYEPRLHIYEGRVSPGQRVPEWIEAFAASTFPHRFESEDQWRSHFGSREGEWEQAYLAHIDFARIKRDPLEWELYVNPNLMVPWTVLLEKEDVAYLLVSYKFEQDIRYPRHAGSGERGRGATLFRADGAWRIMTNLMSPEFVGWIARDPRELAERLETGEYDDWLDFTLHYPSFPEYRTKVAAPQSDAIVPRSIASGEPGLMRAGEREGETASSAPAFSDHSVGTPRLPWPWVILALFLGGSAAWGFWRCVARKKDGR